MEDQTEPEGVVVEAVATQEERVEASPTPVGVGVALIMAEPISPVKLESTLVMVTSLLSC